MDLSTKMATYPRHTHLVSAFLPNILEMFKQQKIYFLKEENILAFQGKKYSGEERLINPSTVENIDEFIEFGIDTLDFVQPDFLFFRRNKFIQSKNGLRTIGIPDLVVEVWSINNDYSEKEMKFNLYSSSNLCEHWYLTQNSNLVECYLGKQKLNEQSLERELKTLDNIKFDLTYLAL